MSTPGSSSRRTLFILGLSALFFGMIAPITPAIAAEEFSTYPQVRIVNYTSPYLTPTVGDELRAVLSAASDPAADAYAYQWYTTVYGGGPATEISGATDAKYTVTSSVAGLKLQVRVTASKAGFTDASDTSDETDPVRRLEFTSPPVVTIDDTTPAVGQTLTANASGEIPAAEVYTYQWARGNTEIEGAVDSTFAPTHAEIGEQISVTVTAIKDGYRSAEVTSASTVAVEGHHFASPPMVTIDDMTPTVGQTLTANASGESPVGDSYEYQWYRDGYAIWPWQTNSTYLVTGDDVDSTLTVTATAIKSGYSDAEVTSASTAAVEGDHFTSPPVVTIDDMTPTVGQTLTANASGESPTADFYGYQWYRNGHPILDETSSTHLVTVDDLNSTITVTATAIKYGYNDAEVSSASTEPTVPQNFTTAPRSNLSTMAPKVGTLLKVTPTGASPTPDSYTYQWFRLSTSGVSTAIAGATGQTYRVVDADLTRRLAVKVTSVKAGYAPIRNPSSWTARVNKITLSTTRIKHGHSLTVTAKKLRAGQTYRIFIGTTRVYTGKVGSTGTISRVVLVPSATGARTVRVSGYNKAGARDFTVFTTITVT